MPLLDIGPDGFVGNRDKRQRRGGSSQERWSYVLVAGYIRNRSRLSKRVVLFECAGVGFALIGMFEEDAVTTAQCPLSVTLGVPCETKARRRIKQVSLHTTRRNSGSDAALHPSIVKMSYDQVVRVRETRARNVMTRIEIPRIVMN